MFLVCLLNDKKWSKNCKSPYYSRHVIDKSSRKRKTPMQDEIWEQLNSINSKILSYSKLKKTVGLSKELMASLHNLETQKAKVEKKLKKNISDMRSQAKLREKRANVLEQLKKDHPTVASTLNKLEVKKGHKGRPSLETNMLGLHEAILRFEHTV